MIVKFYKRKRMMMNTYRFKRTETAGHVSHVSLTGEKR